MPIWVFTLIHMNEFGMQLLPKISNIKIMEIM
jgi:hypothetical protein